MGGRIGGRRRSQRGRARRVADMPGTREERVASTWPFWTLLAVALVALSTLFGSIVLIEHNFETQARIDERQRTIEKGRQFEQLYREKLKQLAGDAVRLHDQRLAELVTSNGLIVKLPAEARAAADAAPASAPR